MNRYDVEVTEIRQAVISIESTSKNFAEQQAMELVDSGEFQFQKSDWYKMEYRVTDRGRIAQKELEYFSNGVSLKEMEDRILYTTDYEKGNHVGSIMIFSREGSKIWAAEALMIEDDIENKFDLNNYYIVDCCYRVMDFKYVNYMDTEQYFQSLDRLQELYIHDDMQGVKTGFYSVSADWNFYKINIDRLENMHQQEMKNKQKGKKAPLQELPF